MSDSTLYIPYTRIAEATEVFLHTYGCVPDDLAVERVDVSGNPFGYLEHFQARWAQGRTFINMEHDTVPWPGALQDLLACERNWCFFGYLPGIDFVATNAAPFGLVKFGASLIAAMPDVWELMERRFVNDPCAWSMCDIHFAEYARERGLFTPHQHSPSVLNANPKFIPVTVDDHEHVYEPSPYASPGVAPVLVCTHPGCESFKESV